jgi:type IV pilus biogenesis protein CpaD/CtpE
MLWIVWLAFCAAGCSTSTPETYSDGSPVPTVNRQAIEYQRRQDNCRHLFAMLGDRSLTAQQRDEIRATMDAKFCTDVLP